MAYANFEGLGWLAEDMQTWTAAHYEPKLQFDTTPVYSVTLAEDVQATAANPYLVTAQQLGGQYRTLLLYMHIPNLRNANTDFRGALNVDVIIGQKTVRLIAQSAAYGNNPRWSILLLDDDKGKIIGSGGAGIQGTYTPTGLSYINEDQLPGAFFWQENEYVESLGFFVSLTSGTGTPYLPTNSTITIYAAKEV